MGMMNRMPALLVLGGLLLAPALGVPAAACINKYDSPPAKEKPTEYMTRLKVHPEHDRMVSEPAPAEPGPEVGFRARNDYAAVLIHRGEAAKAVAVLKAVEAEHPGEYIVAANLGTAYELSGDLAQAHRWIDEGIRRNANAHEGTEWLHLRILEARMALAKDPAWLKSHSVLGMSFGSDEHPERPSTLPKGATNPDEVINALTYQLHERMAFVKAPDAMVGGMLADLGDLLFLFRSADVAIPVYGLALSYQPLHAELVGRRKAASEELVRSRRHSDSSIGLALAWSAALLLGGAGLLAWRHRRPATAAPRRLRRDRNA